MATVWLQRRLPLQTRHGQSGRQADPTGPGPRGLPSAWTPVVGRHLGGSLVPSDGFLTTPLSLGEQTWILFAVGFLFYYFVQK